MTSKKKPSEAIADFAEFVKVALPIVKSGKADWFGLDTARKCCEQLDYHRLRLEVRGIISTDVEFDAIRKEAISIAMSTPYSLDESLRRIVDARIAELDNAQERP